MGADGLPWVLSGHFGLDLVAWLFWTLPSTARLAHMEVTGRRCYSDINGGRFQRPLLGGAWGCRSSAWAADVARSGGDGTWPPQDQHSPDLGAAAGEEIKLPRENLCACTCQKTLFLWEAPRSSPAFPSRSREAGPAAARTLSPALEPPASHRWASPGLQLGYKTWRDHFFFLFPWQQPRHPRPSKVGLLRPAERGPQALQVPRKVG